MAINIGSNIDGHSGIEILKNLTPWTLIPKIKIPRERLKDNHKMIIKWLVDAIPKGNKLNGLLNKTKLKRVSIKGNKIYPFLPICCLIKLKINSIWFQKRFEEL